MFLHKATILSIAILLLLILPMRVNAQACGDFDGSGALDISDLMGIMYYLFLAGSPPSNFDLADLDRHEKLTFVDAALMWHTAFSCDVITPPCPPSLPPIEAVFDSEYRMIYPEAVPSNLSKYTITLTLDSPNELWALQFPFKIMVDGQIPQIDSVVFPLTGSAFENGFYFPDINLTNGIVVLGGHTAPYGMPSGIDTFASIYLTVPQLPTPQPITLEWVILSPEQAPEADSTIFPMVLGYCTDYAIEPDLVSSCCVLAGDINGDGGIDVSDAVDMIRIIFEFLPPNCEETLDVDGSETFDISDAVYMIQFIFNGGSAPVCGMP